MFKFKIDSIGVNVTILGEKIEISLVLQAFASKSLGSIIQPRLDLV
jgi:hypothetical protein